MDNFKDGDRIYCITSQNTKVIGVVNQLKDKAYSVTWFFKEGQETYSGYKLDGNCGRFKLDNAYLLKKRLGVE